MASRQSKPVPRLASPSNLSAKEVSIICPTIQTANEFVKAFGSWLANGPSEVLVVTIDDEVLHVNALIDKCIADTEYSRSTVMVLTVPLASKRRQMARGLERAKGSIIVFVDDDVFWQPALLRHILACFEAKEVGSVGTRHRVHVTGRETGKALSIWERLADRRLFKRNKIQAAVNYLDGGATCPAGRTAAYRSEILNSRDFIHNLIRDFWLGRYLLDAGDDNFCTRWLMTKGWQFKFQTATEAEVFTVALDSHMFLK